MYWKTVKNNLLNQLLPKQWSIALRLMWIYVVSTIIMLSFTAFSFYWIYSLKLQHDDLEDARQLLTWILAIGVIISAVLSLMVTYRSLKPLRVIEESIHRINATQLKERVNPATWPKELSTLAISFNGMLDRIEEGVNRLAQFSGDLAHELRTPINILMGEAEIALSKPRTNAEYCAVIESSIEELARISRTINSILFLARTENPEAVVNLELLSLQQVMHDVSNFYEAAAEEKNIKIYCEGDASVNADALMLRRALSNLVHNALQYTPAGGTITLSAQTVQGAKQISVCDTGEGIAPEHLPQLFNRFYRTDSARSTKTGGTGLGLAIVRSIMDLHQGKVTIESVLGEGTKVTLIF